MKSDLCETSRFLVPSTGDALTLEYNSLKQVDSVKVEHESTPSLTFYKGYEYKTVSETDNRTSNLPEKIKYHDNEETNLLTYLYEYDNMNNITRVKRPASNGVTYIDAIYTYDDFGKLTGATQGSNDYSYAYDKLGNITEIDKTVGGVNSTVTLGYDTTSGWRDRLVSVNGTAITYNAASPGLPATYYNGNKSYRFTWDDQGQLISGIAGTKLFSCQYNADGLRSFKRANNKNHYYYYDGDRLLAEKLATGYILFHYDENDSIYCITYNNGTSDSKYYLIKNLQGDVVQIWDANNNNVVAKYSYDPWGNIVSITNASGNDISADTTHIAYINPIRYRGYYYDAEFGLYYLQSRYYDPAIGRFISADSLMVNSPDVYGYNLFAYCGNNPIIRSDKSGRFWGIVVGAAVVLTVLTGCSTTSSEPVPELEPEPFDSPDEAAIDFAKSTYSSSMYIRYEYGAEIYSVTIDGETTYGYTNPRVGLPHSVVLDPDMVPDGSEFVAIVHTHPNSNNFSRDDRQSATDAICNSYLVCPNKNVLMFDYRSQAIKLIGSFIPSPITSSRKSSLVSQYQKPWNRHLKECGYCRGVQWPAE